MTAFSQSELMLPHDNSRDTERQKICCRAATFGIQSMKRNVVARQQSECMS